MMGLLDFGASPIITVFDKTGNKKLSMKVGSIQTEESREPGRGQTAPTLTLTVRGWATFPKTQTTKQKLWGAVKFTALTALIAAQITIDIAAAIAVFWRG